MLANKDKGTGVGFSSDFFLSGHNNLPQGISTNAVESIDFHIKDNLEVVDKQEWEDIWKIFRSEKEYKDCSYEDLYKTFYHWLKFNYLAPEKK